MIKYFENLIKEYITSIMQQSQFSEEMNTRSNQLIFLVSYLLEPMQSTA